ncbi:MAG: hypothetical protein Q9P01_20625 [Anaerolineae bacterium]|nr:hypothetical protein [Anaerolineae bacterium]MDQ7037153.1 hypothetical protein [Anaerolineae bacterium]
MDIPNFAASFLTFRVDWNKKQSLTASHKPPFTLNNARIQIEAVCYITDKETQHRTQYVLGAACKTEYVGVDENIWTDPNADFCIILSAESFLILKSWDKNDKGVMRYPASLGTQPERQTGQVRDTYDSIKINLRTVQGEQLDTVEQIVNATLADDILVGRMVFTMQKHYEVMIDFPIKTMNANERELIYQTDTGPILFPDFTLAEDELIANFRLAYVAFNSPDWAEVILQVPTPLNDDLSVNHYSKAVHLKTQNSIFRMI